MFSSELNGHGLRLTAKDVLCIMRTCCVGSRGGRECGVSVGIS